MLKSLLLSSKRFRVPACLPGRKAAICRHGRPWFNISFLGKGCTHSKTPLCRWHLIVTTPSIYEVSPKMVLRKCAYSSYYFGTLITKQSQRAKPESTSGRNLRSKEVVCGRVCFSEAAVELALIPTVVRRPLPQQSTVSFATILALFIALFSAD